MSYVRSNLMLGGKRLTVREAAQLMGVTENTISARISKGWTRRQVLGLDSQPGSDLDVDCEELASAIRRYERSQGPDTASRAMAGDVEALGTLAAQGVTLWDHCHHALLGSDEQADARRNRPTRLLECGCRVDSATGVTVQPCGEHHDPAVRRGRRRTAERERKLVVAVNMLRGS